MSDSESSVDTTGKPSKSKKSKKEKKSKKDKKSGKDGRLRGKDRERSRSPSRLRASRGSKKSASLTDMSLEEMADRVKKFGHFELDPKSGAGTLRVSKRVMGDDIDVIVEVLKRYTETQHVYFEKAFITDDIMHRIVTESLNGLRHLKSLGCYHNMLTDISINLIIATFAKKPRQLQHLDFRRNNITTQGAETLFKSLPNLQTLSQIPVYRVKRDGLNREMDLAHLDIKLPEIQILVSLLQDLRPCHIDRIDLSSNQISSSALTLLAQGIRNLEVHILNLNDNPLTDNDLDFEGKSFSSLLSFFVSILMYIQAYV
jgi:Leucine-rich repeat (LRR) protein